MAGLAELKKKLQPLFDAETGPSMGISMDSLDSYMVANEGAVNLLSKSCGVYSFSEHGLEKRTSGIFDDVDNSEQSYRCSSREMHVFGAIGCGSSSVVYKAIHTTVHRILALKKINVFEKEKRQQLLNEVKTLCEAACFQGLVEFHGAFYTPEYGQISIALEYVDGGSLADVLLLKKSIPEPILSHMVHKLLLALGYLHGERRLVHRDIKPANLLINLKGETKISDFGISAALNNSISMCETFVGTVTYMSPERIRNESYSYSADIWSFGVAMLECATGKFPYSASEGAVNLMLQIMYDPSPSPPKDSFSPEFCSFIDSCLNKDPSARPRADELLTHPFIKKYEKKSVDLAAYIRKVFDPVQKMKDMADMLAIHYYLLFDGADGHWHHAKSFYDEKSVFRFSGKQFRGQSRIFPALTDIRRKLTGNRPREKLIHVVEKLHCRSHGDDGIAIRASGSFIFGNQFLICGNGVQAEGLPNLQESSLDLASKRMGSFQEQFIMEPGSSIGVFMITEQDLYIQAS
ncbi:mitogen-activated protein kinase kinase 3 [Phalaenopsis equestris]|uniref:mitogen-activated protein kinase kinase 3 n=1 Tax=Phalaenopsis equestris TaxID=78828 RepID=UPI0009E310DD|nr:mitogen-activated protein kinase kinase 3 [Phalaenopsis equestris]XP_020589673.1 mitogen-activated protein kinase kinase 3 [Phalaenopsis equestris]